MVFASLVRACCFCLLLLVRRCVCVIVFDLGAGISKKHPCINSNKQHPAPTTKQQAQTRPLTAKENPQPLLRQQSHQQPCTNRKRTPTARKPRCGCWGAVLLLFGPERTVRPRDGLPRLQLQSTTANKNTNSKPENTAPLIGPINLQDKESDMAASKVREYCKIGILKKRLVTIGLSTNSNPKP